MARVKDLWYRSRRDENGQRVKTKRHPDLGGNPDAKRWLAIWLVNGRERSEACRTEKIAKAYGTRMEDDIARGEYIDPATGRVTIGELAAKWLSLREIGTGTARRYESCYRLHIAPVFGDRPAGTAPASDVAAWSKSLAAQPGTRNLALVILTGIFDLAVADKIRRDNPAKSDIVGRPALTRVHKDAWPARTIHVVADSVGAEWHDLPLAAAGLGLRQGEVFGLGAEDIDHEAGVVHVRRQYSRRGTWKLPKGGKVRDVPLPRGVAALVGNSPSSRTLADRPESMSVSVSLPWEAEDGTIGDPVTVQLLWARGGRPVESWWWHRFQWKQAIAAAGLPAERANGMHALRHWYSTALLDNGVSLAAVMDFMGHSRENAPLAVGVYGHVTPEAYEAARQAVDKTLFRLRSVSSNGTVAELGTARRAGTGS